MELTKNQRKFNVENIKTRGWFLLAIPLLVFLSACNNNAEFEITIQEQNERITELERQLEEQEQLNFEQQAKIEFLTYKPEWQEIITQDLIENISEILIEAQMCQAHIMLPSEVPSISPHGEPDISFGVYGNVVVRVGGGHWTRQSHALLRWQVNPEARRGLTAFWESDIHWDRVQSIDWEVIGCFSIGGEIELAQLEETNALLQPLGSRLERLPSGYFQVTDAIQLGIARRTDGNAFEGYFNLDSFNFYHKEYTSGPYGTTVILIPNVEINDFRFFDISVAQSIGENYQVHFVAGVTSTALDTLSPEEPFVVTFRNRGSFPSFAFSFTDDHGTTRYFSLGEDLQDGGFIVGELVLID